jgi:hypothetical protein
MEILVTVRSGTTGIATEFHQKETGQNMESGSLDLMEKFWNMAIPAIDKKAIVLIGGGGGGRAGGGGSGGGRRGEKKIMVVEEL